LVKAAKDKRVVKIEIVAEFEVELLSLPASSLRRPSLHLVKQQAVSGETNIGKAIMDKGPTSLLTFCRHVLLLRLVQEPQAEAQSTLFSEMVETIPSYVPDRLHKSPRHIVTANKYLAVMEEKTAIGHQ